jgi:hypothetical protein
VRGFFRARQDVIDAVAAIGSNSADVEPAQV